jgi:DNA replication and repair protein RecF
VVRLVTLKDFRNYEQGRVEFKKGINVIIAENGRGKTNLLEALFLLLEGRSMRGAEIKEMVKEGRETATVSGTFYADVETKIRVVLQGEGTISGRKKQEGMGAVCFQPDDMWMLKGGPEGRRKYLDEVIVDIKKGYRETLREYGRVLRQRNEAIKAVRKGARTKEYIRNWNPLLVELGREVVKERVAMLEDLESEMNSKGGAWGLGALKMKYYSTLGGEEEGEEKTADRLGRLEDAEIRRGSTMVGPHRDEIVFALKGKNLRRKCSQGEQKLVAVLWRLAQASLLERERRKEIVLLMDDCLSELDSGNRLAVVEGLRGWGQVILTTTDELAELRGTNWIRLAG